MTAPSIQEAVIASGLNPLSARTLQQLAAYLELLLRWNAKLNLTAIRGQDEIVLRHFVESLFCAQQLPSGISTLLDFGSGAGFPGLPVALCRPEIAVTLGESQAKKAAFLREAVRTTEASAEVYQERIESIGPRRFDCITLRAVDRMREACLIASHLVLPGGWMAIFSTRPALPQIVPAIAGFAWRSPLAVPGSEQSVLLFGRRLA